jgi:hypothetical protein
VLRDVQPEFDGMIKSGDEKIDGELGRWRILIE